MRFVLEIHADIKKIHIKVMNYTNMVKHKSSNNPKNVINPKKHQLVTYPAIKSLQTVNK